ncbi:OprD family outer membrane porin [Campylobacter sp. CCUG 57310]|uniref:OprD family outer membrane porin n=1 Tax=Campylobacter sp. CCUG 57310 TaxID=2517362 RepID=UPI001566C9C8|nr:OprD family outer membrane porin [Campylobacter sp. CCUG 57310]QKF91804.1 major outer membrane protein [Campylobacter sp. CCUG 57310]
MKLTKISLATLVALGAFSSVASATPLEEAIKNVDLSGFVRYRYENVRTNKVDVKTDKSRHRFRSIFAFKAALDDNFFGVLSFRYDSNDNSGKATGKANVTDTSSTFAVNELYLGYTRGNTTVKFGKQMIGSYFTDDEAGTGVKLVNKDIEGLTLAAFAFDDLENSSRTDGEVKNIPLPNRRKALDNNLYGVAAMGSYNPVNFELWYASLVDVANLIAADVAFDFGITDDVTINAQVQYGHADVEGELAPAYRDTDFYAAQLGTELFGADLAAGYIGWKVKDKAKGFITLEDNGNFIDPTEQAFGNTFEYTNLAGKGNFWFVTAAYKFDKFGIGADYIKGDVKEPADKKTKIDEVIARASYNYSAKLKFKSYFSHETEKVNAGDKAKSDKFRFEAKYSF